MKSEPLSIPLCVDLDGTLVKQDLLYVAFIHVLKKRFMTALSLLYVWPTKGRAALKKRIAANVTIDLKTISFNQEIMQYLVEEHHQGRKIILVTGNDGNIAQQVADYLGVFSEVIASDGKVNLTGKNKAQKLISRFGSKCFDYIGNTYADIAVWKEARKVYVAAGNPKFVAKVNSLMKIDRVFNW